jgi:DNA-binding FadR family transcriptional regulator
MIAAQLRDDILTGRLKEGDVLANQERLFSEYQVSPPALREAMRILETDGLITVRRGNVGGAVVHAPTPQRAAQMIAMVLQTRATSPSEVSVALGYLEPICARLCALREDRAVSVVPILREIVANQRQNIEDTEEYLRYSRDFHSNIVALSGNEPMIVVIGALQAIWSAHDSLVWETMADGIDVEADPSAPLARSTRRAALRAHEKLVEEIELGNADKANNIAAAHLRASHTNTLRSGDDRRIIANLLNNTRLGAEPSSVRMA